MRTNNFDIKIKDKTFLIDKDVIDYINSLIEEKKHITENLNNLISQQTKELEDKNNNLLNELHYDSLTKLKNRKSLIKDKQELNPTIIYIIDIQSFSVINDLYGEKVGNTLLQKVAEFIQKYAKSFSSEAYRLHGNTFAILSRSKFARETYDLIVRKFILMLENHDFTFEYNKILLDFAIHVKIGVAITQKCPTSNLIEYADMALNYAKKNNRDFALYDLDLGIEQNYDILLETIKQIKEAINENRVIPYFQEIHTKDKVAYESLIRIKKKDGTTLLPYQFLDIAKNTRLYFKLSKIMIEKTFKIFQNETHHFSINLSYLDIEHSDTLNFIKDMFEKYKISPNRFIVEIVESETFDNYEEVMRFLNALRDMGIKIAIDDFGSGYSNFSHLIKLDPDYVKINGSLIKDIDTNPKSFAVTKAIVNFAKEMNIKIVAEYIHSKEVYNICKNLGIDAFQGFLFAKPQDIEDIFKST